MSLGVLAENERFYSFWCVLDALRGMSSSATRSVPFLGSQTMVLVLVSWHVCKTMMREGRRW